MVAQQPRSAGVDAVRAARALACFCAAMAAAGMSAANAAPTVPTAANLSRLSIEELAEIEISSVSKRPERLAEAAASVFVITADEIRRFGATTLAEALRLAPNLQVARVNAHSQAITARGFNNSSANKLLVMIDGRSVYTPLHAGVFWDAQDLVLADVERIEVISGPGGALWGANAVNGVINILTRSAADTAGTLVDAAAGTSDDLLTLRHGVRFGDGGGVRGYAKHVRGDNTERADGAELADDWERTQAGFRADWGWRQSAWTLQGDVHDGEARVPGQPDRDIGGANLLARWSGRFGDGSTLQVQGYIDHYSREQPGFFSEDLDTVDIDVQHQFTGGPRHEIVWGGGYREHHDSTSGGALLAFVPADRKLKLANVFAQDTIVLAEGLKLNLGVKFEHNSYTGWETQPNLRVAWRPNGQSLLWSAVSRAVRTPSRLDRDFFVFIDLAPPYSGTLLGGPDFVSEEVTAYEIGYRGQPTPSTSFSVTAFYNDYDRLRSVEPAGPDSFVLGNGVEGRTSGLEAWGRVQVHERWRLGAGVALLRQRFAFAPGSADPGSPSAGGNDPEWQFSLRSNHELPNDWTLDLGLRAVDALPNPSVPSRVAVDARLGWKVQRGVELSLAGFDLFDERHPEFGAAPGRSEIGRNVSLRLTWTL